MMRLSVLSANDRSSPFAAAQIVDAHDAGAIRLENGVITKFVGTGTFGPENFAINNLACVALLLPMLRGSLSMRDQESLHGFSAVPTRD